MELYFILVDLLRASFIQLYRTQKLILVDIAHFLKFDLIPAVT